MTEKQGDQALEDLRQIRSMMERSSRFISLSGLSGIGAGVVAIIGAFIAGWYIDSHIKGVSNSIVSGGTVRIDDILFLLLLAAVVLFLALGIAIYFAVRKASKQGLPIWNKAAEVTLINLLIPLGTGAIFCLILYTYGIFLLLAPTTLVFYGLALVNASQYTLREVRYLGISEIILGLIALAIPGYSLIFWSIGFGFLHIIYGSIMYFRYER